METDFENRKFNRFLKENFEKGIQMFDTPNIVGDFMVPIYKEDNILVLYAPEYY